VRTPASSYASRAEVFELETRQGLARVHLRPRAKPAGGLVLGHGAGGGIGGPDLAAATEAALSRRFSVALVEQPYRVAGRRSPAPARQLDAAWVAVVEHLRSRQLLGLSLIAGGRSAGARVACRTAEEVGASGVLCLAFPLLPPRRPPRPPAESRQAELDAVGVPTLVVQGEADPFGVPPPSANRTVVTVPGTHSLNAGVDELAVAVGNWLDRQLR
jgi:uncharacterized protein